MSDLDQVDARFGHLGHDLHLLGIGQADDHALFVDDRALLDLILGPAPIVLLVVVNDLAGDRRVDHALGDLLAEDLQLLPFQGQLGFVGFQLGVGRFDLGVQLARAF